MKIAKTAAVLFLLVAYLIVVAKLKINLEYLPALMASAQHDSQVIVFKEAAKRI